VLEVAEVVAEIPPMTEQTAPHRLFLVLECPRLLLLVVAVVVRNCETVRLAVQVVAAHQTIQVAQSMVVLEPPQKATTVVTADLFMVLAAVVVLVLSVIVLREQTTVVMAEAD